MAKIPQWWQNNPSFRTQTELLHHRKRENLPDPTFDIDGDGEVGPTDLFLATNFDKDKDRKLNAQERAEADQALKSGYLNNFEFGLERCGPHKPIRQLQLRGMMIMDDDFRHVKDTYPFERTQSHPNFRTFRDLKEHRRNEIKAVAEENVNRRSQYKGPLLTLVHSPKAPSKINPKWSELNKEIMRTQQGMIPKPTDLNSREISLNYSKNPQYNSCADLLLNRKKETQNHNFEHKNPEERLKEREESIVLLSSGINFKDKVREMHRKDLEHNMKTFANLSIGIHGKELPKFKENCKEYWKKLDSYNERPPVKETEDEKIVKVFVKKEKQEIAEKPNQIYPFNAEKAKFLHERVYTKHVPTKETIEETIFTKPTTLTKNSEITKSKRPSESVRYTSINGTKSIAHESAVTKYVSGLLQNFGTNRLKSVRTGGFSRF